MCIWWTIWRLRRNRCFENKSNPIQKVKVNYILSLHFWCEELVDADPILDFLEACVHFSFFCVYSRCFYNLCPGEYKSYCSQKKKKKLNAVFAEELPHTLCVNEKRTPNW